MRTSLDIVNLKEVVFDAWSLLPCPPSMLDGKNLVLNIEEARISNYLFQKGADFQVNYVEGGSLKNYTH